MELIKSQKKFIKNNYKRMLPSQIALHLGIRVNKVEEYLKKENYKDGKNTSAKEKDGFASKININLKTFILLNWKQLLLLIILTFIVYSNALTNDFISDDILAIKENPNINNIKYFFSFPSFNVPAFISFMIYKTFGLNLALYHLPNIIFHFGSAIIIYFILVNFFFDPIISLFAASLFIVHPIQTEAVSWISGAPYSSSGFLILISFASYCFSKKNKYYYISIISYILALMTLEKLVLYPVILLLYELFFGDIKVNFKRVIPFFIFSGIWLFRLSGLAETRLSVLNVDYYGTRHYDNPLIKIPVSIVSYILLIIWPKNLTLYHSEITLGINENFVKFFIFILLFFLLIYFLIKEKKLFFWVVFFIIPLSPTFTPLPIAWIVAERYVYLSALGIYIIIAYYLRLVGEKIHKQSIAWLLFALIISMLSVRTYIRNRDWRNEETFWYATSKISPDDPKTYNNMGVLYYKRGDYKNAIKEFEKAIKMKPNYGDAYNSLGNTYFFLMGDTDKAIQSYEKALLVKENFWQPLANLAEVYYYLQQYPLAFEYIDLAIQINSVNDQLYFKKGIFYSKLDKKKEAKEAFVKALEINPNNQEAKKFLIIK